MICSDSQALHDQSRIYNDLFGDPGDTLKVALLKQANRSRVEFCYCNF